MNSGMCMHRSSSTNSFTTSSHYSFSLHATNPFTLHAPPTTTPYSTTPSSMSNTVFPSFVSRETPTSPMGQPNTHTHTRTSSRALKPFADRVEDEVRVLLSLLQVLHVCCCSVLHVCCGDAGCCMCAAVWCSVVQIVSR